MSGEEKLDLILKKVEKLEPLIEKVDSLDKKVDSLDKKVTELDLRMEKVEVRLTSIELSNENIIQPGIKTIAQAHSDLGRKLDEALKITNDRELLSVRVSILEEDVRKLKAANQ